MTTSRRLFLDAPADLRRTATVELVAAGDFSGLAEIVADLRSAADPTDATSLSFTAPGQAQAWEPRTASPDAFRYELRTTQVYADGSRHESDWTPDDRPVVIVRDVLRFDVTVVARLLDLGGAVTLALVELELDDGGSAGDGRGTLVLRDREEEPHWSVRLDAPERHTYRYRLTLVAKDGTRTASDWSEAEDSILVLRPAAQ